MMQNMEFRLWVGELSLKRPKWGKMVEFQEDEDLRML